MARALTPTSHGKPGGMGKSGEPPEGFPVWHGLRRRNSAARPPGARRPGGVGKPGECSQ
ncbi:MAG TPA: hypothetical protein VK797_26170 [Tepidisphaeraceae bacterium]|nr:hypothetical protein [Tepidisphaeraceae bacterium]